jgi:hypothetical protein
MTIEVRQLVVRSNVGEESAADAAEDGPPAWVGEVKRELLAECQAWLEDRLKQARER